MAAPAHNGGSPAIDNFRLGAGNLIRMQAIVVGRIPAPYWVFFAFPNTSKSTASFLAFAHNIFPPFVGSKP